MNISLCIATYRRPERLRALLDDLVKQRQLPQELIVVDNDAAGSALAVVKQRRQLGAPFPIYYDIQPLKNISLTRNRSVALATCEWLAFIDDDERAPPDWLWGLADTIMLHHADGGLGPVIPIIPRDAPSWVQRGDFHGWTRMETGSLVPLNKLRFGNVLLRAALVNKTTTPFDPAYGLTGGEDGDLLSRLVQGGARIVWCDHAIVHEPVESARLSLRWLLLRAMRGGQDFARHSMSGNYGRVTSSDRTLFIARAVSQALLSVCLAMVCWPAGRHHAVYWLLKTSANLGKLSVFMGWHYQEYGDPAS